MHRFLRRVLFFTLLAVATGIPVHAGAAPSPAPPLLLAHAAPVAPPLSSAPTLAHAERRATPVQPAKALPENVCNMLPPEPILLPHAYARQTVARKINNEMLETALLDHGLRVEILQSRCVDFDSTELIFIVPTGTAPPRADDQWIDFARSAMGRLKTRRAAPALAGIDEFLKRSRTQSSNHGVRAVCNDGSIAEPGQCSWESLGGFVVSVKRSGPHTRVAVISYVSG